LVGSFSTESLNSKDFKFNPKRNISQNDKNVKEDVENHPYGHAKPG
jgi:hypothetical protein